MLPWRDLNRLLPLLTEGQVLAMLEEERAGRCRVAFLERLHQRYSVLRSERERAELLKEGRAV